MKKRYKFYTVYQITNQNSSKIYIGVHRTNNLKDNYFGSGTIITKAVKKPVLEIDTFTLFKSIDAVGKKVEMHAATCGKAEPMQGIPVWMGGPEVRIRNVRIN